MVHLFSLRKSLLCTWSDRFVNLKRLFPWIYHRRRSQIYFEYDLSEILATETFFQRLYACCRIKIVDPRELVCAIEFNVFYYCVAKWSYYDSDHTLKFKILDSIINWVVVAVIWIMLKHVNEIKEPLWLAIDCHIESEDFLKLDECGLIGLAPESVPLIWLGFNYLLIFHSWF